MLTIIYGSQQVASNLEMRTTHNRKTTTWKKPTKARNSRYAPNVTDQRPSLCAELSKQPPPRLRRHSNQGICPETHTPGEGWQTPPPLAKYKYFTRAQHTNTHIYRQKARGMSRNPFLAALTALAAAGPWRGVPEPPHGPRTKTYVRPGSGGSSASCAATAAVTASPAPLPPPGSEQSALSKYQKPLLFDSPSGSAPRQESLGSFGCPVGTPAAPLPQGPRPGSPARAAWAPGRQGRQEALEAQEAARAGPGARDQCLSPARASSSDALGRLARPRAALAPPAAGPWARGAPRARRRPPSRPPTPSTRPEHGRPQPADVRGHLRPRPHDSSTISFRLFGRASPPGRPCTPSPPPCCLHAHPQQAPAYLLRSARRFRTKPP